jgi:hypothetical protein
MSTMSQMSDDRLWKAIENIQTNMQETRDAVYSLMTRVAILETTVGTNRKRGWRIFELFLAAALAAVSVHFLGG